MNTCFRPSLPALLIAVLVLGGSALGLVGCADNASEPGGLERGAFVMRISGAVQDTVRGAAYLRDAATSEPGLELDADSVGWSVHWMQSDTVALYAIMPHTLLRAAQSAATDGGYHPEAAPDAPPLASLFMDYGARGSFEAQAGTLFVDRATPTDHVGRVHATLLLRGPGAPRQVRVTGRWHAVPAPESLPSHLQK